MQRQLAIKIMAILVVGLVVLIPVSMVKYKVYERQGYSAQAKSAVAESWTGQQRVVTPVLVIPYRTASRPPQGVAIEQAEIIAKELSSRKQIVVVPDQLKTVMGVDNSSVFKGIYEIPVYNGQIQFSGEFSAEKLQGAIDLIKGSPRFESLGKPFFSVHISDVRGIDQAPVLQVNERELALEPGSKLPALATGLHSTFPNVAELQKALMFSMQISLRGMGSFSFVPLADDATATLSSNWPHPEFIGASLPRERNISNTGFVASWSSSRYSSNGEGLITQCVNVAKCQPLLASASGVNFIEPVDIYLQSERSIKYAMLFIGLSFITFFIFEHIANRRIHPIQYAFVGFAIAVFYLLLISLAEHIAFHWAYLFAVLGCSSLILFYVRYMLRSFLSAALFCTMISGLYGVLYVIVQAEDFALLMGAVLVFVVLAVLMYVTRKIDWYNVTAIEDKAEA